MKTLAKLNLTSPNNTLLEEMEMMKVYGGNTDAIDGIQHSINNSCSSRVNPSTCTINTHNCTNSKNVNDSTKSKPVVTTAPGRIISSNLKTCRLNGQPLPENSVITIYPNKEPSNLTKE